MERSVLLISLQCLFVLLTPSFAQDNSSNAWFSSGAAGLSFVRNDSDQSDVPFPEYESMGSIFSSYPDYATDPVQRQFWNKWSFLQPGNHTFSFAEVFDDYYAVYTDIDGLNENLNANETGVKHRVIGTFVTCHDDGAEIELCDRDSKIGPSHAAISDAALQYMPVAMTTDWNMDHIVVIRNTTDAGISSQTRVINVIAYIYAIYTDLTLYREIVDQVNKKLFPNASSVSGGVSSASTVVGASVSEVSAMYQDVDAVHADVGHPNTWASTYGNFYWEPYSGRMVLYEYAMMVSVPDQAVYDALMYVSTTTTYVSTTTMSSTDDSDESQQSDENSTWMIVGIVFIVLFAIAVGVIVYLLMADRKKSESTRGEYTTVEMIN